MVNVNTISIPTTGNSIAGLQNSDSILRIKVAAMNANTRAKIVRNRMIRKLRLIAMMVMIIKNIAAQHTDSKKYSLVLKAIVFPVSRSDPMKIALARDNGKAMYVRSQGIFSEAMVKNTMLLIAHNENKLPNMFLVLIDQKTPAMPKITGRNS